MIIRLMKLEETEVVADLWLETSIAAHSFVAEEFWYKHYDEIKDKYLPCSVTYVAEEDEQAIGFISILAWKKIGGLFVAVDFQRQGIGRTLLEQAKVLCTSLELDVYAKNEKAVQFYLKQGFNPLLAYRGGDTGQESFRLRWLKNKADIKSPRDLEKQDIILY